TFFGNPRVRGGCRGGWLGVAAAPGHGAVLGMAGGLAEVPGALRRISRVGGAAAADRARRGTPGGAGGAEPAVRGLVRNGIRCGSTERWDGMASDPGNHLAARLGAGGSALVLRLAWPLAACANGQR